MKDFKLYYITDYHSTVISVGGCQTVSKLLEDNRAAILFAVQKQILPYEIHVNADVFNDIIKYINSKLTTNQKIIKEKHSVAFGTISGSKKIIRIYPPAPPQV